MKKIKLGIFGAGRGLHLAKTFMLANAEIVALCDFNKERLNKAAEELGEIALYSDFDSFIEHRMDGVVLANYFNEHAPYAIKLLERGINVFSECIANGTMAEGVALARAAEKSGAVYMLAENYPFMIFNKEMKLLADGGTLGKILYAEGEYNHPADPNDIQFKKDYNYFPEHWRNYLPRTYYVTHSLAPIMRATGATPKRVSALCSFEPSLDDFPGCSHVGDRVAIITTQNDDGSVFRVTGCAGFGGHGNAYRLCGTKGSCENLRGMRDKLMIHYNDWEMPEGVTEEIQILDCQWRDKDEEIIKKSGHGGGDYLVCRTFLDCIAENKQPEFPFDVYSAINMASVAILSHRSMLEGGVPYDIPDMRNEEVRKLWENDYLTPFIGPNGEAPTLPCCSKTDYKPTETQVKLYHKLVMGEDA